MATDPMRNFKFKVQIAGFPGGAMGFSKVSGLNQEVEVIEYREGGDVTTNRKFPGQTSFGNVTLERGITADSDLVKWMTSIFDAEGANTQPEARYNVTITVLNKQGNTQRVFKLLRAFPASREIGDLDASANEILIESLELAHDGMVEELFTDAGAARPRV